MSKRAEAAALKAYPKSDFDGVETRRKGNRKCFIGGYEQAEKDTIERVCAILNGYFAEDLTSVIEYLCKAMEEE